MYYLCCVQENCTKLSVFACLSGISTPPCTIWHVLLILRPRKLHKVKCFCMSEWHKYTIMHSLKCTTYTVFKKIAQSVFAWLNGTSTPSCSLACTTYTVSDKIARSSLFLHVWMAQVHHHAQFDMYYLYSVWQNCTKLSVFACLTGISTSSCTVWYVLLIQCLKKLCS